MTFEDRMLISRALEHYAYYLNESSFNQTYLADSSRADSVRCMELVHQFWPGLQPAPGGPHDF